LPLEQAFMPSFVAALRRHDVVRSLPRAAAPAS
jgi:hypothetical protein